jgi:hypothetical protein
LAALLSSGIHTVRFQAPDTIAGSHLRPLCSLNIAFRYHIYGIYRAHLVADTTALAEKIIYASHLPVYGYNGIIRAMYPAKEALDAFILQPYGSLCPPIAGGITLSATRLGDDGAHR